MRTALAVWLFLTVAVGASPPVSLRFHTVPPGCQVAQSEGSSWRSLGEGPLLRTDEPLLTFRLLKPGYRDLEVRVPRSQLRPGTQVWPPPPRLLVLEPLVSTATFYTWPAGARLWLPVPGGGREYLGLSGRPVPLNLARLAGDSGRGVFELQVELPGFYSDVLLVPSHSFQDQAASRWPPAGSYPLRPRVPGLVTGFYLTRDHPLAALALLLTGGAVLLRPRRPASPREPLPLLAHGQLVPPVVGAYRLGELLGCGGVGLVYEARREGDPEPVAIKLMRPVRTRTGESRERFRREVQAMSRLSHPHILRLLDWGELDDGLLYLVMERAEGRTLRDLIESKGLPLSDFARLWEPVVKAVEYAHSQGVLHRDLKPENVLLSPRGPLVADFGLCRLEGTQALTATLDVLGTPGYLAPELLLGQPPSHASDQYALGVMAYELLCGQAATPWSGAAELGSLRPDLPAEVVGTVRRMLASVPEERFPSLAEALQGILSPVG